MEAMDYVMDISQRASEAMSQASMPCTSAGAILPVTSQNMAESSAAALQRSGAQSSMILSAMLGMFILAAAAAFLLFQRLEKQEAGRRQSIAGGLTLVSPNQHIGISELSGFDTIGRINLRLPLVTNCQHVAAVS